MNHTALTAKYRPQTFAAVAGQQMLKAILSRAALEDKVAAAYLFSGTRGVGKTTLARVFAKALNCRNAPTAEPCNTCDLCRAVALGSAVDVVEIDGASNRGIDDVRRLKEVVGYAPMEGRYKIFIIDEAHMLSREAFNALLKTLEEPPARVTFIMATTEPHKFPATIVSRCQHYVFKSLSESELLAHMLDVLAQEGIAAEEAAVRLLARRGAGSVRDAMSLLGQVLALGHNDLSEQTVRSVLGLAGQEAFVSLLQHMQQSDVVGVSALLREMLDGGLDLGFFLRELVQLWRNLFLLKQSGAAAREVISLPMDEANTLLAQAEQLSLGHIHACWQMCLEGQRRVLTSIEPALALELLLLNMTIMPQLVSLEQLSSVGRRTMPRQSPAAPTPAVTGTQQASTVADHQPVTEGTEKKKQCSHDSPPEDTLSINDTTEAHATTMPDEAELVAATPMPPSAHQNPCNSKETDSTPIDSFSVNAEEISNESLQAPVSDKEARSACSLPEAQEGQAEEESTSPDQAVPAEVLLPHHELLDEQRLIAYVQSCEDMPVWIAPLLRRITLSWEGEVLVVQPEDTFTSQRLADPVASSCFHRALTALCGKVPEIMMAAPLLVRKERDVLKEEVMTHPLVQLMEETLQARVIDFGQLR